jgi:hypothetical protein
MVVVGPLVVHVLARVAVCFGVGVGEGLGVAFVVMGVAAGAVVFATVTTRFFVGAGDECVGEGVDVGVWLAVIGGDCVSCTSTFADPLLQAAAASIRARAAATVPEVRMTA